MNHSPEVMAAGRKMAEACARSIRNAQELGLPLDKAEVTLSFPLKWKAPPGFPRRTLLSQADGRGNYAVNCFRLLAWLEAARLVELVGVPDDDPSVWSVRDGKAGDAA